MPLSAHPKGWVPKFLGTGTSVPAFLHNYYIIAKIKKESYAAY